MFKTNFSRFDSCGQNTDYAIDEFLLALCNAFLLLCLPGSHINCLDVGPELSRARLLGLMSRGIGIQPKLSRAAAWQHQAPTPCSAAQGLGKAAGAGEPVFILE